MKKIYLLAIVMLITSCAMLAPKFDNAEYSQFVDIYTHSTYIKETCGTNNVTFLLETINFKSASLVTYVSHLPNNEEILQMAIIIDDDVKQLIKRNKSGMSKTYCELKAEQLIIKLDIALASIGNLN